MATAAILKIRKQVYLGQCLTDFHQIWSAISYEGCRGPISHFLQNLKWQRPISWKYTNFLSVLDRFAPNFVCRFILAKYCPYRKFILKFWIFGYIPFTHEDICVKFDMQTAIVLKSPYLIVLVKFSILATAILYGNTQTRVGLCRPLLGPFAQNFVSRYILPIRRLAGPKRALVGEIQVSGTRHFGFGFFTLSRSSMKVFRQIWCAHRLSYFGAAISQFTLFAEFKMTVIWTKSGTPIHNEMPMMIRKYKSKLEFQHVGYRTDTTEHISSRY